MSRPNPFLLTAVLLAFLAVFSGAVILKGGLYLDSFEIDSYHLMDILFRMHEGQKIYFDFVTPLGLMAALPITTLLGAGLSIGAAIAWSQVLVAIFLFPFAVYSALTRFGGALAYLFGMLVLGLTTALTHGGDDGGISFGMYYNRWAWAISFIILALAILPPRGRDRPILEGAMIGGWSAVLLLLKITYFAAVVPPIVLLFLLRRDVRRLGAAIAAGSVILAITTLMYGLSFWAGYLNGILNVLGSEARPSGGMPLGEVIGGNSYLAITALAIVAVMMVSRAGHEKISLALLFLVPGFIYVTFQNFGSDPQWVLFLPFLLLPLRPNAGDMTFWGMDLRFAMGAASAVATALIAPSLVNLLLSPVNHAAFQRNMFEPMLPAMPGHTDLFIRKDRAQSLAVLQYLDDALPEIWSSDIADNPFSKPNFQGVAFPRCELQAATLSYYTTVTEDLVAAGIPEGSQIFTADLSKVYWLFGPYEPLQGGAPWYYAGLTGIENADYLLVPKCSFVQALRNMILHELDAANLPMTLVRDNDLYALFKLD